MVVNLILGLLLLVIAIHEAAAVRPWINWGAGVHLIFPAAAYLVLAYGIFVKSKWTILVAGTSLCVMSAFFLLGILGLGMIVVWVVLFVTSTTLVSMIAATTQTAMSETEEEPWVMAEGSEDELPVNFRMRECVPAGIETTSYPRLINIHWRCESPENQGMPTKGVHDQMVELEQALESIEGPELGFMVLSKTGNRRKEWIWYVANEDQFFGRFSETLKGRSRFPIEIEAADDPTWKNYIRALELIRRK